MPNKPLLRVLNYYGLRSALTKTRQDALGQTHKCNILIGDTNDSIPCNTPSQLWHRALLNRCIYNPLHELYPDGSMQTGNTGLPPRRCYSRLFAVLWACEARTYHTIAMPTSYHRLVLMTTGLSSTQLQLRIELHLPMVLGTPLQEHVNSLVHACTHHVYHALQLVEQPFQESGLEMALREKNRRRYPKYWGEHPSAQVIRAIPSTPASPSSSDVSEDNETLS